MLLNNYLLDGADAQSRAVLCLIQNLEVCKTWNGEIYTAKIHVSRWENGREQGYVIHLLKDGRQFNIAFFQHRNGDSIHAVKWESAWIASPTIHNIPKDNPYHRNKFATNFSVAYGEIEKMANFIEREIEGWY